MGLILDSSVVISNERSGISALEMLTVIRNSVGKSDIALSVITVMELEHGIWRAKDPTKAGARRQFVEDLIQGIPVFPVTIELARRAGRVDAEQRSKGIQIATADLLIGISALAIGYTVATSNTRHFENIPGLSVLPL
jgi:tRNA(fMet)-specific endonuclease VapC